MNKCKHNWKPSARRGPSYFFGVYCGEDWHLHEDVLACASCGKRRATFLSVCKGFAVFSAVAMLYVVGLALLGGLAVMIIRTAFQ